MGYYSDITIAVAFANKEDMEEVLAIYAMDDNVKTHDLLKAWEFKDDNVMLYTADSVKWYESYEDVQGIEYLMNVVVEFHEHRDTPFAYRYVRIGEDDDDMEVRENHGGEDGHLIEMLWDRMRLVRHVETHFG